MSISLHPVLLFLEDLRQNNNREWFNAHKKNYQEAHGIMIEFADALLNEMQKHDFIETASGKRSLLRIYRDVRFSKDKRPYKTSWSGSFKRATTGLRGGYYYHIEPGNSFIAGGFFGPNTDDLRHIRNHIDQDDSTLRTVLNNDIIKSYFGLLIGDQVKSSPKGFTQDHPAIDLLKYKQFLLKHYFTDHEVITIDFYKRISKGFQNMRPFFDVMSEILTTDLNGISLI
jgi:uncharacterized protein (TIGR02453 family)